MHPRQRVMAPRMSLGCGNGTRQLSSRGGLFVATRSAMFQTTRIRRFSSVIAVILSVSLVCSVFFLVVASPAEAQQSDVRCEEGEAVRVLFLLDTSRSLRVNDPDGRRKTGTVDALDDLYRIVEDYRLRLRRHYPRWSVFAAVDTFSGFHDDPGLSKPVQPAQR